MGFTGGLGNEARRKAEGAEEEAPAEGSAGTTPTDWGTVVAPCEPGLTASALTVFDLRRTVLPSRGPGFDIPGIRLDGGTIFWYSDMRPDS